MATVTLEAPETPSQQIINAANQAFPVTDARGRTLEVRDLDALGRGKMLKVIGGENATYMAYACTAFFVAAIDGEKVARPATEIQLDALIQRLGKDGMDAVQRKAADFYPPPAADAEEQLKNGSGTPT